LRSRIQHGAIWFMAFFRDHLTEESVGKSNVVLVFKVASRNRRG
jgi:hypothetical protein